ncbi:queuine tRNA-ribosyltransferase [Spirochaetia bacterium]|nr:queuine tRNA-ribosyltransferase [Spirochaetia bacterium]
MSEQFFSIQQKSSECPARTGIMKLPHGDVTTPVFMPVGTNGTVKAMTNEALNEIGFEIILGNTYHLYLRPGTDVIQKCGSLHDFSKWQKNILTDSGGFQIFSLPSLRKITEEGAKFRSHIDGSEHFLTPEKVVDIQTALNSDIQMQLDVCSPYESPWKKALGALIITEKWLNRAKQRWNEKCDEGYQGKFFSIVQGNFFKDLREKSAESACAAGISGIAIGGLSVGEPHEVFSEYLSFTSALLPQEKPRYVMGIGTPDYILEAIENGIDMFDCVLPTRLARNGQLITHKGNLLLKKSGYETDFNPVDPVCNCHVCKTYSRAYMHHLFKTKEILFSMLSSYHNLFFLHNLVLKARMAIQQDCFLSFKKEFLKKYYGS